MSNVWLYRNVCWNRCRFCCYQQRVILAHWSNGGSSEFIKSCLVQALFGLLFCILWCCLCQLVSCLIWNHVVKRMMYLSDSAGILAMKCFNSHELIIWKQYTFYRIYEFAQDERFAKCKLLGNSYFRVWLNAIESWELWVRETKTPPEFRSDMAVVRKKSAQIDHLIDAYH